MLGFDVETFMGSQREAKCYTKEFNGNQEAKKPRSQRFMVAI